MMKHKLEKWKDRWTSTNQEPQAALDDQTLKGLLAEYNTLRSEILNAQGRRMQIISLTVGAFGVILSITGNNVLGSASIEPMRRLWVTIGGAVAIYTIVIPSLLLMRTTHQTVMRLGRYIRVFIEPHVPGLNYEYHWQNLKTQRLHKGGHRSISRLYFFLSTLPLLLPIYALSQYMQGWAATLTLIPFVAWSIYLSRDLQTGASKDWQLLTHWDDYASKHSAGTHLRPTPEHCQMPNHDTAPELTD